MSDNNIAKVAVDRKYEAKIKIYIVDSFSSGKKFNDRWTKIGQLIESWGNAKVHYIDGVKSTDQFNHYINNSTALSSVIDQIILDHNVSLRYKTIWIFPNALNPTAIHLKILGHNLGLDFCMIGYWTSDHGSISIPSAPINWLTKMEKLLVSIYDYNLVESDFLIRSGSFLQENKSVNSNIVETKLPYNSCLESLNEINVEFSDKYLVAIQTSEYITDREKYLIRLLKEHLPDINFIEFSDMKISSYEYFKILAKSTALICITTERLSLYSIIECMLLGVIPIIPDTVTNRSVIPKEYLYDKKSLTVSYLEFLRIIPVYKKIIDAITEDSMNNVINNGKKLVDKYYDDVKLREILNAEIDIEYKLDREVIRSHRALGYQQWKEKQQQLIEQNIE